LALLLWPLAASAGACPNDELRSELRSGQLPDCRAYELVTPSFKEGAWPQMVSISPDGQHVISANAGVFAGSEGDTFTQLGASVVGALYESSRTPSHWVTSALSPPASVYQDPFIFYDSSDVGPEGSLWGLAPNSGPYRVSSFYLERPRGTFVSIGPATVPTNTENNENPPGYEYEGASRDLSHVLFIVEPIAFRWPWDETTGGISLYEYVGTGNAEPSLVGVSGGAGSRKLISRCGTWLGSSGETRGSVYNAVSESGDRVFFTAISCGGEPSVNEVFAREEVPGGQVRTVPISEPSISYCSGSPSPPCENAHFEGASLDGSKVFFTTEQELQPGARGRNLYEYDFNAPGAERIRRVSVPLSGEAEVQGVSRISEDGSEVYFVAYGELTSTPNKLGEQAQPGDGAKPGMPNLYAFDTTTGETEFVATLAAGDSRDWRSEDSRLVEVSREGRFLVFQSSADLTHEGVSGAVPQVFRYDRETDILVRASIGQEGYNDDGRSLLYGAQLPAGREPVFSDTLDSEVGTRTPEDGAVFFSSPDALTPHALNDVTVSKKHGETVPVPNVYEYARGRVYLLSDGQDTSTVAEEPGVRLLGASASGGDAFFTTSDSLIGQDTDSQMDIYDARAMGGFPEPQVAAGCSEAACQGPLGAAPVLVAPGSATQAGEAPPPAAGGSAKAKVNAKPKPKAKAKVRRKTKKRRGKRAGKVARHGHGRAGG